MGVTGALGVRADWRKILTVWRLLGEGCKDLAWGPPGQPQLGGNRAFWLIIFVLRDFFRIGKSLFLQPVLEKSGNSSLAQLVRASDC
jgi:hypothetical protein